MQFPTNQKCNDDSVWKVLVLLLSTSVHSETAPSWDKPVVVVVVVGVKKEEKKRKNREEKKKKTRKE